MNVKSTQDKLILIRTIRTRTQPDLAKPISGSIAGTSDQSGKLAARELAAYARAISEWDADE